MANENATDHVAIEMQVREVSGRYAPSESARTKKVMTRLQNMTMSGVHVEITLLGALINVPVEDEDGDDKGTYTLVEVLVHNTSAEVVSWQETIMVDSDGYQHESTTRPYGRLRVIPPQIEPQDAELKKPQLELLDHVKTRGWIWFGMLTESVIPKRLLFYFAGDGGETLEIAEITIGEYALSPMTPTSIMLQRARTSRPR